MKFRKKPVVIEAITWDELVAHGVKVCHDEGRESSIHNGMAWSFSYNGHQITHENDSCYIIPTLEGSHNMTPDDMLITGVKGEIYPCKLDIFAATYDKDEPDVSGLSFGRALEAVKAGKRIAREGWNGAGMFVYYVPANSYPAKTGVAKQFFGEGALVPYRAYLALKTAQGDVATWAPSGSDALAEDWIIID